VPVASLVHFPYAVARAAMDRGGGSWTTDRATLDATRRSLGLPATAGDIAAWESPQLLLATLPRWFDAPGELPAHVVHAGPLGVHARPRSARRASAPRALLAFSTTAMEGQSRLVANACAAVDRAGIDGVITLGPALDRSAVRGTGRVTAVEWGGHDGLMARSDLVVTHGGLGTTLRALAHGLPLLILPLGRDQDFNAAQVERLGAGLRLPPDSAPAAIAGAIGRLVAEDGFREAARRLAARIASERADDRAADALAATAQAERFEPRPSAGRRPRARPGTHRS
jgi:UDP:flavonoid glycosyltransferase YjiC (YdhE family)